MTTDQHQQTLRAIALEPDQLLGFCLTPETTPDQGRDGRAELNLKMGGDGKPGPVPGLKRRS